jgi:ABC-2 type transport system ATP-binding protein
MTKAVIMNNVTKRFVKLHLPMRRSNSGFIDKPNGGFGINGKIEEISVLDRVSFQVEESEIFGLVGKNGSGKSTLIRLLAGLLKPDEGKMEIFGFDLNRQPEQCMRWINWISIKASFFKQISAMENLVQSVRQPREDKVATMRRAEEILMKLDLDQKAIHLPMETLRQDQLQKVTVARALLACPRLLLLDEPTRGLDKNSRQVVYKLIKELHDETGSTVLLTGQESFEMQFLCDRIAVLEEGRLLDLNERECCEAPVPFSLQKYPALIS